MRRILLLTLCAVLLYVVPAKAADELKLAFMDLQRVFAESDAGKKARADIVELEKSKKSVIEEKVSALKKMEEELNKQSSVLSAEAKKVKEEEFDKQQKEVQKLVLEARQELQKKETELTNAILKNVSEIVDAIGYEEGYAIIFRSEVVLSAKKEHDITAQVIKRLNEGKFKAGEPKAKTKPEPKSKKKK